MRIPLFLPLSLALLLSSCGGGDNNSPSSPAPDPTVNSAWTIGPIIGGKNYSIGEPLHPTVEPDGFSFPIGPTQEPHYVTFRHGSLTGKTRISMTYRVEGEADTRIYGKGCSENSPSAVTLYFQRKGDNWGTDGWRWWATFATQPLSVAGTYGIEAPLDGPWTSVLGMSAGANPDEFAAAKDQAESVGFTFGNCEGYGHGARATAPVKFVVTGFTVATKAE